MSDDARCGCLDRELEDEIVAWIGQEWPPEIKNAVRFRDTAYVVQYIVDRAERKAEFP